MKKLLAIDDEVGTRMSIQAVFNGRYEVTCAASVPEARDHLKAIRPSIVLLDIIMPGEGGLDFLKELKEICPGVPVLMISASFSPTASQTAMQLGAQGIIHKPFDVHELRLQVDQAVAAAEKPRVDAILDKETTPRFDLLHCATDSRRYRDMLRQAKEAARDGRHVFLHGETGTGKELIARQIHHWSARGREPFICVRATDWLPGEQGLKLFGTAGMRDGSQPGRLSEAVFDLAEGGTVYLDRVDLLQPEITQELGQIIRSAGFRRTDSPRLIPTAIRLIFSAPDRKVHDELTDTDEAGGSCALIDVPALRERREDIPALANYFLHELRQTIGAQALQFSPESHQRLASYHWPGNLRELRNVIERAMLLFPNAKELDERCLPMDMLSPDGAELTEGLEAVVSRFETDLILKHLKETKGNVAEAARRLATTPRKLQYRINRLKLPVDDR